jgi:hypothetical protein
MVLVIDDSPWSQQTWLTELQASFSVVTISTLAGASVAIEGQDVAAVILVLFEPDQRPRPWISALRRHPSLERVAVFVLARDSALVAADLLGLPGVDVIDPEIADFDLCLRVGAVASRMSSRPVPRRRSESSINDTRRLESLVPKAPMSEPAPAVMLAAAPTPEPVSVMPEFKLHQRFARECVVRGERGLALCERLSQRAAAHTDRARAAEELVSLLSSTKGDAARLQLRELALLFGMAELVASRLNVDKGQLVVPRGVVGLLSALLDLGRVDQLLKFDVELHRTRLSSAIER